MAKKGRIDLRLASRILVLQLVRLTLALVIAFVLFAVFNRQRLDIQYHLHALDIGRVVASSPTVVTNIAHYDDASLTPSSEQSTNLRPAQSKALRHGFNNAPMFCSS